MHAKRDSPTALLTIAQHFFYVQGCANILATSIDLAMFRTPYRDPLHKSRLSRIHLSGHVYRKISSKDGFAGLKGFRVFRETGPMQVLNATSYMSVVGWAYKRNKTIVLEINKTQTNEIFNPHFDIFWSNFIKIAWFEFFLFQHSSPGYTS